MNERIKALAVEAGLSIRGHYDESGSTPAELQKFAELIVRELKVPAGYTAEELERDNPYNQWMGENT